LFFAAKHFDPQLGIDAHTYLAPPGVWPSLHIGMVFDPFDYLPTISVSPDNPVLQALSAAGNVMQDGLSLIGESTRAPEVPAPPGATAGAPESVPIPLGATVEVAGVKRANAGTGGLDFHILIGAPMPVIRAPAGPQFDDELFMGSRIVLADGDPFSRITMPVLACNVVGMIPPFRPKKLAKKVHLSLLLPTTFNIALPVNVFVGGPPTISWASMMSRAFLKALGKGFKAAARKVFKNMPSGFLKCKVLRAEPVDLRDGSVSVEHQDFEIPGRLPLAWTREYSSSSSHDGVCGHGWQTPADIRLEIAADGTVCFIGPGQVALFEGLPQVDGSTHYLLDVIDGARLWRTGGTLVVRTKDGLRHCFEPAAAMVMPGSGRVVPIERIEDACGNHWRFVWRGRQLMRIVERGHGAQPGRVIEVGSQAGRIREMALQDPDTQRPHVLVSYRHEQADLAAVLDALGAARSFEYVEHRMVRHTDRLGLSFSYAYDTRWRVVHAWGDDGLYDYRFAYDDTLRQTRVTDSLGHVSVVTLDENRLPLCEVDPLGGVTVFEYDESGRTVAVIGPEGLCTRFAYDARGNLLRMQLPDGSSTGTEYDEQDQVLAVIDPLGHRWPRSSDGRGLLLSQTDPLGAATHFAYDSRGQLTRITDPRGAVTELSYDAHGQLASLRDPLGHASRFEHDALGRLTAQCDPLDRWTRYHHDGKGRVVRIFQPDGSQIACAYDAEDQLVCHVDEAGAETRLEYAGLGKVSRRTQADGHSVSYRYDTEEQLVGLTNERGEHYALQRDTLGRIVEEVDYWGQSRRYDYDGAGRLVSTLDPLGQRIAYTTDKLGRILCKTLPDTLQAGRQVQEQFAYDAAGRLVELRNPSRHVRRRYDAASRLLEETQDGFRVISSYDAAGNRVLRETSAGNRVACTFDLRNQVASIAVNDEPLISVTRDALGRATREQLDEHAQRHFAYEAGGRLTAQAVLVDAHPVFETRYDHDAAGHLIRRTDNRQGVDEYRYDALGRLLQHTDPKGRIERFLNDPANDRLRTVVRETPALQVAGGAPSPASVWMREGDHNGLHYVFDRAGDLVSRRRENPDAPQDLQLLWDANHRLVQTRGNGRTVTYGYDALGRRAFKRDATHTTWFFWDGDALLGETRQRLDLPRTAPIDIGRVKEWWAARRRGHPSETAHGQAREYVYYPDSFVPLALVEGEGPDEQPGASRRRLLHYYTDPNGSPIRVFDGKGATLWSATYTAWGHALPAPAGSIDNPLRYQGQYHDPETGLHYNRYRYFDSNIGQFVGQDPLRLATGSNLYAYAPNAIAWADPLGLHSTEVDYGSTDLSQMAQAYRMDNGIFGGRNVAVFEYLDHNGMPNYVTQVSQGKHAERRIAEYLDKIGIKPEQVTRVYTELAPCPPIRGMQYCRNMLDERFKKATVTHSFEYGESYASRRRGVKKMTEAARKLFRGC